MPKSVDQGVALSLDPEIHRIAGDQFRPFDLAQDFQLEFRVYVGQENVFCLTIGFRELWMECLKNIQMGFQGMCFIEIITIATLPSESFTWTGLQARQVDATRRQELPRFIREIITDNRNQLHSGKEAGGG